MVIYRYHRWSILRILIRPIYRYYGSHARDHANDNVTGLITNLCRILIKFYLPPLFYRTTLPLFPLYQKPAEPHRCYLKHPTAAPQKPPYFCPVLAPLRHDLFQTAAVPP